MCKLLPAYVERKYVGCTKDAVCADVDAAVRDYVREMLGGDEEDGRITGSVSHLIRFCHEMMWRVVCELKNSRFVPISHEVKIGEEGGLPAWNITTPSGSTVHVHGTVDRVDAFRDGDKTYIRIVDYKTGTKTFNLEKVLAGLDMQMLIYLFALCENAEQTAIPAGVLYLPAKLPFVSINREVSEQTLDRERFKTMCTNGLLIDDPDVLRAMEPDLEGLFIPVSILNSGELSKSSSLATLEQFGYIRDRIQRLLTDMAEQLHVGAVDAVPIGGDEDGCRYCDYHDVCCHEPTDPIREFTSKKLDETLSSLNATETEVNDCGLDT